ncbi:hypothetical protein [uncultured Sphingomonas sp.]|uniref:hypothetical protein n=1 Tax=uncultured Sphingomonas sp. TaxID=158754 RepID=UPI0035CABBDF
MDLRRLTPAHRALLLLLVALAMAVRAAVPAGWMPMTGADGATRLVLCPGSGPVAGGGAMPGMAMVATSLDGHHDPAAPAADHDCPFGVTALAVDLAVPLVAPLGVGIVATTVAAPSPALLPGRGRGLAAPPPPSTGPPALA